MSRVLCLAKDGTNHQQPKVFPVTSFRCDDEWCMALPVVVVQENSHNSTLDPIIFDHVELVMMLDDSEVFGQ